MICQAKVKLLNQTTEGNNQHKAAETVSGFPALCRTNSTSRRLAETEVIIGVDTPADVQHISEQQQRL